MKKQKEYSDKCASKFKTPNTMAAKFPIQPFVKIGLNMRPKSSFKRVTGNAVGVA